MAQRKALLQESMKATTVRAATMDKKDARDEQVKSAIAELEKAFNQAKPAQKEANLKRLVRTTRSSSASCGGN